MYQNQEFERISPKIEQFDLIEVRTRNKVCFICLNDASSDHRGECEKNNEKYSGSSVNILTSYILQYSLCSSTESEDRKELQRNILSSFTEGNLHICSECHSKAESLLKLHLELEKVQMQILDVLKNLQNSLKSSEAVIEDDLDATLSCFQAVVQQEFRSRGLSDGTEVRLERLSAARCRNLAFQSLDISEDFEFEPVGNSHGEEPVAWNALELDPTDINRFQYEGSDYSEDENNDAEPEPPLKRPRTQEPLRRPPERRDSNDSGTGKKKTGVTLQQCDICLEDIPYFDMEPHLKTHPQFEKYYTCDICPDTSRSHKKLFGSYKGLVWHHLKALHNLEMPCVFCPDQTILFKRRVLCKHLYEFHQLPHPKLQCTDANCSEEFYDPLSRQSHLSYKHSKSDSTIKCDICLKTFMQKSYLREHKLTHSEEKLFKCDFDSCSKQFKFESTLKKHLRTHEEGYVRELLECTVCGNMLKTKQSLQNHLKVVHGAEALVSGAFTCPVCEAKFKTKSLLDGHMERRHSSKGKEAFKCESCPKEFPTKEGLQLHVKANHEAPEKVACPQCPKMLCKSALFNHIRKMHNGKRKTRSLLRCQFCTKTFQYKRWLRQHEETHWDEEGKFRMKKPITERTLKCHYCPKVFANERYLSAHERTAHADIVTNAEDTTAFSDPNNDDDDSDDDGVVSNSNNERFQYPNEFGEAVKEESVTTATVTCTDTDSQEFCESSLFW